MQCNPCSVFVLIFSAENICAFCRLS